jgi:hypothetical protein
MASVGASEDHVSGLRAEGVLAVLCSLCEWLVPVPVLGLVPAGSYDKIMS